MKIACYENFGGPEVVRTAEVDIPNIADDEVLIKVYAVAYNFADGLLCRGLLGPISFPHTVGVECSGVIVDRGSDICEFETGDRVLCAVLPDYKRQGCSAEYIAVRPAECIMEHIPFKVSLADAAALVGAGLTAYQGIYEHLRLWKGQSVFIAGGAGGVGHYAVQIAKHVGAFVIASGSAKSLDLIRHYGADEVVDYREPFPKSFGKVDAVFNAAPLTEEETNELLKLVRRGGRLVSVYRPADRQIAEADGIWTKAMAVHRSTKDVQSLIGLVMEGSVKPYIEKCYTIDEVPLCMAEAEHGHGKRLILIDEKI